MRPRKVSRQCPDTWKFNIQLPHIKQIGTGKTASKPFGKLFRQLKYNLTRSLIVDIVCLFFFNNLFSYCPVRCNQFIINILKYSFASVKNNPADGVGQFGNKCSMPVFDFHIFLFPTKIDYAAKLYRGRTGKTEANDLFHPHFRHCASGLLRNSLTSPLRSFSM